MAAQLAVDVFEQERRRLEVAAVELRKSLAEKDVQLRERCSEAAREEAKLLQIRYASELKEAKTQVDELQQRLLVLGESARAQAQETESVQEQLQAAEDYENKSRLRKEVRREEQACLERMREDPKMATLRSEIRLARDSRATGELQLFEQLRLKEEYAQQEAGAMGMSLQEQIAADLKDQLFESQETVASLEETFQSMQSLCLETEEHIVDMLDDSNIKAQAVQKDEDSQAQSEELMEETQKLDKTNAQLSEVQRLHVIAEDLAAELRKSGQVGRLKTRLVVKLHGVGALVCDAGALAGPSARSEAHAQSSSICSPPFCTPCEVLEGLLSEEHQLQVWT